MNFSLGRAVPTEARAHIARCRQCRRKLARLEAEILAEGLQMQGQASLAPGEAGARQSSDKSSPERAAGDFLPMHLRF
jgi:hypothetical protein